MKITGPITEPIIQAVEGRDDLYRGHEDWICPIGNGRVLHVAAGFLSDGGSIPRLVWPLVGHPLQGRALPGFYAHDALYASELLPRAEADQILFALNKRMAVPMWKRDIFWTCVTWCGWNVWRKHTLASVAAARELVWIELEQKP